MGNNAKVRDLIDRLNLQDREDSVDKMTFSAQAGKWKEAA
jgi:hypothetical protein